MQRDERQKEKDEDQKILDFAQKKERLDKLREDKTKQKFDKLQSERQKLIDRQCQNLMNTNVTQIRMLNKQVEEAETKAAKLFERDQKKKADMKVAIERSRQMQI